MHVQSKNDAEFQTNLSFVYDGTSWQITNTSLPPRGEPSWQNHDVDAAHKG